MSNKKKVTFHCDMTNDEIFAILDSVQSDEENDVENILNDSDTEFECITKDAEDFIMNAESSATQENVLEVVIHPETMAQIESDCDFVINNRNICSHAPLVNIYKHRRYTLFSPHLQTPTKVEHLFMLKTCLTFTERLDLNIINDEFESVWNEIKNKKSKTVQGHTRPTHLKVVSCL